MNSVRRMESFSVRALVRRVKTRLPATAAMRIAAAMPIQNHFLELVGDAVVVEAALTALEAGAAETW